MNNHLKLSNKLKIWGSIPIPYSQLSNHFSLLVKQFLLEPLYLFVPSNFLPFQYFIGGQTFKPQLQPTQ